MIICAADIHFRWTKPPSRIGTFEEFIETQFSKFEFMLNYCAENEGAVIIIAGDLFHQSTGCPSWMLSRLITLIKKYVRHDDEHEILAIPGQHDLPYHQLNLLNTSNMGVLLSAGVIYSECPTSSAYAMFPWGVEMHESKSNFAVTHRMVIESEKHQLYPHQTDAKGTITAKELLSQFSCYNLIVSGDNHRPFAVEHGGRWLVNPGSMTRQRLGENHMPGFYVYNRGNVERIEFPCEKNVLADIRTEKSNNWSGDLSKVYEIMDEIDEAQSEDFSTVVQEYFKKHNIRPEVQKLILG